MARKQAPCFTITIACFIYFDCRNINFKHPRRLVIGTLMKVNPGRNSWHNFKQSLSAVVEVGLQLRQSAGIKVAKKCFTNAYFRSTKKF